VQAIAAATGFGRVPSLDHSSGGTSRKRIAPVQLAGGQNRPHPTGLIEPVGANGPEVTLLGDLQFRQPAQSLQPSNDSRRLYGTTRFFVKSAIVAE